MECMGNALANILGLFVKAGAFVWVANEIRGLILVAPVMYALFVTGGSLLKLWIAICSLAGIAISVVLPMYIGAKLQTAVARLKSDG